MRQRGLPLWDKDDPQARAVRAVGKNHPTDRSDRTDPSDAKAYDPWLSHPDPAVVANALLCLIHQANYLLDRQLAGLEKQFVEQGGYSERLQAARLQERQRQVDRTDQSDRTDRSDVMLCPACGKPLVLRTAQQGAKAGQQFWGCSAYPTCRTTRPV